MLVSHVNKPGKEIDGGPGFDKKNEPTLNLGTPVVSKSKMEDGDKATVGNCSTRHSPNLEENEILQNKSSMNEENMDKKRASRSANIQQIQTQMNISTRTIKPEVPVPEVKSSVNSSTSKRKRIRNRSKKDKKKIKRPIEPLPEEPVCDDSYKWELDATQVSLGSGFGNQYRCLICEKLLRKKSELFFHRNIHSGETPYSCQFCPLKFMNLYKRNGHMKSCSGSTIPDSANHNLSSSNTNQNLLSNRNSIKKEKVDNLIVVGTHEESELYKSTLSIPRENKRPIKLTYKAAQAQHLSPFKLGSKSEENLESNIIKKSDSRTSLPTELASKKMELEKTTDQFRISTPSPSYRIRKRTRSSTNTIESQKKLVISISKVDGNSNQEKKIKTSLPTKKRNRSRTDVPFKKNLKPSKSSKSNKSQPSKLEHCEKRMISKNVPVRDDDAADIIKALREMDDMSYEGMHSGSDTFLSNKECTPGYDNIQENMFSLVSYQGEDMGYQDDLYVLLDANGKMVTFDQVQIIDDEDDEYMDMSTNECDDYQMDYQKDFQYEEEEGELFPCMWCEKVFKMFEFKNIHEKMAHSPHSNSSLMESSTIDLNPKSTESKSDLPLDPNPSILDLEVFPKPTDSKIADTKPLDSTPNDSLKLGDSTSKLSDEKPLPLDQEPTNKMPLGSLDQTPESDKNPLPINPEDAKSTASTTADQNQANRKPLDPNPSDLSSADQKSKPTDQKLVDKKPLDSNLIDENKLEIEPHPKPTNSKKADPKPANKKSSKSQLPSQDKQAVPPTSTQTYMYNNRRIPLKVPVLCLKRIEIFQMKGDM